MDLNLPLVQKTKGNEIRRKLDLEDLFVKNKLSLILGLLGIFLLGIGVLSAVIYSFKQESGSVEILPIQETSEPEEIFIHVAGAVEKPGLYQLSSKARVNDVLIAAGGLSAQANRDWFNKNINLAQKLSDGTKIYIPFKNEPAISSQIYLENSTLGVSKETKEKININTASLSQLESLPGIGSTYAQRIVEYRNNHGSFSKIEDIMNISGIGPKLFEKIKDQISIF